MEITIFMFFLAILAFVASPSMAVDYPISWTQGLDYSTWSTGKTINAGDTLTFTYNPSLHSVDELSSKSTYDNCNTAGAKSENSGNTKITLDKPNTTYYFACGFSGHCAAGMKLAVTTSDTNNNNPTSSPALSPDTNSGSTINAPPITSSTASSSPPPPTGSGEVSSSAAAVGVKAGFVVMLGLALVA
ncbi:hypothetical protein ZOSMA_109G00340 [Zostera marina]|uniref:Phytocyanin domain-containing protein n=1 Tax=Zostera marina TaxID=29655 RepID=A0A0K9Q3T6_ZOSMR|nr:hypothetical protein ZOSMA_109G00340 [Zostera marina]